MQASTTRRQDRPTRTSRQWFRLPSSISIMMMMIICLLLLVTTTTVVNGKKSSSILLPEASSSALKIHKLYTLQPPHDMTLYSILEVSPNATSVQIAKSYRRLSRQYHPDKLNSNMKQQQTKQQRRQHENHEQQQQDKLQNIQNAYEILKDDTTRLLYHKYGIIDSHLAVILLLGPTRPDHFSKLDPIHSELLQLIGRDFVGDINSIYNNRNEEDKEHQQQQQRERVLLIAARIVELLRPIIEGTVHPHIIAHQLAQDCDRWKKLPLGAQIIRCVGRSYRHAGQDYLKNHPLPTPIRKRWHTIKGYWTAIIASSRATVTEKQLLLLQKQQQRNQGKKDKKKNSIEYYNSDDPFENGIGFLDDDDDDEEESDIDDIINQEDIQKLEQFKAKHTVLQALQVEALWQITKIDIDKTVRKACDMILNGQYFFFPSHQEVQVQHNPVPPVKTRSDGGSSSDDGDGVGWVSSSGKVIYADEARIEAAKALILLGNVMVQRSKDGTAWKE